MKLYQIAMRYSDWIHQRPKETTLIESKPASEPAKPSRPVKKEQKRLSYKENKELEELPNRIAELEAEQTKLIDKMSSTNYHTQSVEQIKLDKERAQQLEEEIATSYQRWEELEEKKISLELG